MAVKKRVPDKSKEPVLKALEKYIEMMNEQTHYLPSTSELIKICQDIVKCLACMPAVYPEMLNVLQGVEEFLLRVVNMVSSETKQQIVTVIFEKFYTYISDPQFEACPAASIVLIVLDEANQEAREATARWLVQQADDADRLRVSLGCLYRWICTWHGTPSLPNWLMAYVRALEDSERFDILTEVSLENLGMLFSAMCHPHTLRQSDADVIFHVLASLRESAEALDKIAPQVGILLESLAADSSQWGRQLLQKLVDILTCMLNTQLYSLKGDKLEMFKDKYTVVTNRLEDHMASGNFPLPVQLWRTVDGRQPPIVINPNPPPKKVGLSNLGNTCYMNSVLQALLVTRRFSTQVMLRMNTRAYWARIGALFANMIHSTVPQIQPYEFLTLFKPTFFTLDNQHDSSEFLGYLFELLKSYEFKQESEHDYSTAPVLSADSSIRFGGSSPGNSSSDEVESTSNRRSVSPRPGSSTLVSSSLKRRNHDVDTSIPRKRKRVSNRQKQSFVDCSFGGTLITRVECTECQSSSISRDNFRDLQLAFPEKPIGGQYSVQSLLDYYCTKERLSGDNRYECRRCGCLRDAEKRVLIDVPPQHLILVLKNFKFDPKFQVLAKLMHPVHHNHTVSLPTIRNHNGHTNTYPKYNLYAAVIHAGATMDSGHYYTIAKDCTQWHIYNDDSVTICDENEFMKLNNSSTAYILFYRRADIEETNVPTFHELPPNIQEAVVAHNKHYGESLRKNRSRQGSSMQPVEIVNL